MTEGLARAIRLVRELRQIDPGMTLTCAYVLLLAARHEGRTLSFFIQQTGATKSMLSRYVQVLAGARGSGAGEGGKAAPVAGHGLLLTRESADDRREREVFLTERGRALAQTIEEIMRGSGPRPENAPRE